MAKVQQDNITILLGIKGYEVGKVREGRRILCGRGRKSTQKRVVSLLWVHKYLQKWQRQRKDGIT